jgi:hypothetical protein
VLLELLAVVGFVVASVVALVLVRRRIPLDVLAEQHEVAGVCFAVLGGLYGIILAFVLVSSWERYEEARAHTEIEASVLADLYRHAQAFSEPTGPRLGKAVDLYLESVVNDEFVAMADSRPSEATQARYYEVWQSILDFKPTAGWEIALYQNTLDKLDTFGDARRHRLLFLRSAIPLEIWGFLIVFGATTVAFTYFFGMPRLVPQILITTMLSATIGCALLLVHETQHPFAGGLRVHDVAFRLTMDFIRRVPVGQSSLADGEEF